MSILIVRVNIVAILIPNSNTDCSFYLIAPIISLASRLVAVFNERFWFISISSMNLYLKFRFPALQKIPRKWWLMDFDWTEECSTIIHGWAEWLVLRIYEYNVYAASASWCSIIHPLFLKWSGWKITKRSCKILCILYIAI